MIGLTSKARSTEKPQSSSSTLSAPKLHFFPSLLFFLLFFSFLISRTIFINDFSKNFTKLILNVHVLYSTLFHFLFIYLRIWNFETIKFELSQMMYAFLKYLAPISMQPSISGKY